jgi:hypothetical protein
MYYKKMASNNYKPGMFQVYMIHPCTLNVVNMSSVFNSSLELQWYMTDMLPLLGKYKFMVYYSLYEVRNGTYFCTNYGSYEYQPVTTPEPEEVNETVNDNVNSVPENSGFNFHFDPPVSSNTNEGFQFTTPVSSNTGEGFQFTTPVSSTTNEGFQFTTPVSPNTSDQETSVSQTHREYQINSRKRNKRRNKLPTPEPPPVENTEWNYIEPEVLPYEGMEMYKFGRGYLLKCEEDHSDFGMKYYPSEDDCKAWWQPCNQAWFLRREHKNYFLDNGAVFVHQ